MTIDRELDSILERASLPNKTEVMKKTFCFVFGKGRHKRIIVCKIVGFTYLKDGWLRLWPISPLGEDEEAISAFLFQPNREESYNPGWYVEFGEGILTQPTSMQILD